MCGLIFMYSGTWVMLGRLATPWKSSSWSCAVGLERCSHPWCAHISLTFCTPGFFNLCWLFHFPNLWISLGWLHWFVLLLLLLLTLKWWCDLNSNHCQGWRGFKCIVPLDTFMTIWFTTAGSMWGITGCCSTLMMRFKK